ncbi:hypothetical protein LC653_12970 [Nostoc sp. CHAB 5784]|uniref:hypothetical protein n=1 Tax=Nostoc mirabile TaxID=2907820 RepID=UPI001E32C792|nr:hypothetical protein [Nostoc mirabile]MCC5664804.1 hypothetical protein [Nostoc mirabile CHAB5784]
MSRLKRWLNMNQEKVSEDGSLKPEYLQKLIADNMRPEMINKHAQILKDRYLELKHLDETDPESWILYTAYDFFTPIEKTQFNPDGSLRKEYFESEFKKGTSLGWLEEMERRKKIEVDNYNKVSADHIEQGINFGAWLMRGRIGNSRTYGQRRQQMEQDLRNFEDVDSLPFDKDTAY